MEERIQNLYYEYQIMKLDLVFDFECTGKNVYSLGEDRFGDSKKESEPTFEVKDEDYGPHGDYLRHHLYKNGELIDTYSYETFKDLGKGYYSIGNDIKKDGNVIAKNNNYRFIHTYSDGFVVGIISDYYDSRRKKYIGPKIEIITDQGEILFEEDFISYYDYLGNGHFLVEKNGYFNIIDINGNNKLFCGIERPKIKKNNCFIKSDKKVVPLRKELLDYKVTEKTFGHKFVCDNGTTSFTVSFEPVRIYNHRYSIGFLKDKVYLYDRVLDKYKPLGDVTNIEYSENDLFIIDKVNKKAYLVYGEQFLDISRYYNDYLENGTKFSINDGVKEILSQDEFTFKKSDEIDAILKEEREKIKQERLEIEEQKKAQAIEAERKRQEQEEKELKELEIKAISQLQESIQTLQKIYETRPNTGKIHVDNIFNTYPDYLEVKPEIIPILRIIDLSLFSFTNVKMDNIDFSYSNISFDPQTIYNKNLRGSSFEGVFISPWVNFTGVDIRGCRFSPDKNNKTLDFVNSSFEDAIYDETTLYDGVPLTQIFGGKEEIIKKGP